MERNYQSENSSASQRDTGNVLLVSKLVAQFSQQKRVLILIFLLFLSVIVGASFLVTPTYKSDILVKAISGNDDQSQLSLLAEQFAPLASLGGIELSGSESKDEYLAILKSRKFTYQFITRNNLLPILFAEKWDSDNSRWLDSESDDPPTLDDAYKYFDSDIRKVNEDRKTGHITLSIEWHDRFQAADWSNQLVAMLNEEVRAQTIDEATRSIAYLESQLQETNIVDLQRGIVRLIEGQLNRITLAKGRKEFVFKVIDPAIVRDEDDVFKPDRVIWILGGVIVSAIIAIATIVLLSFYRVLRDGRLKATSA